MPYLIDGHNLIPKTGLSLRSLDDEPALIKRLQEFSRLTRQTVEVYFDGAPPGQDGVRKHGTVTAHFVRQGTTADEAIRQRLVRLGRSARNWTVVSSDRQVQAEARSARAAVISSDEFAGMMAGSQATGPAPGKGEKRLSPDEVAEWMELFRKGGK
ncbi:MAG: NYN domain-containing protein [Chloroflexota bacterium]